MPTLEQQRSERIRQAVRRGFILKRGLWLPWASRPPAYIPLRSPRRRPPRNLTEVLGHAPRPRKRKGRK